MERRFWLGLGILGLLLAVGLWGMWGMGRIHDPVAATLDQAAKVAMEQDLEGAATLARQAKQDWQKKREIAAAGADHEPMDEIESLFAELEVYAHEKEQAEFAAGCLRLSKLVQAMAEAHALHWWNFL